MACFWSVCWVSFSLPPSCPADAAVMVASLRGHGDDNLHGSGADRAWIGPALLGRIFRAASTSGRAGRDDREVLRHAHAHDRRDNKPAESRIGNCGMGSVMSGAGQEHSPCRRKHFSAATFVGGFSGRRDAAAMGLALHGSFPFLWPVPFLVFLYRDIWKTERAGQDDN